MNQHSVNEKRILQHNIVAGYFHKLEVSGISDLAIEVMNGDLKSLGIPAISILVMRCCSKTRRKKKRRLTFLKIFIELSFLVTHEVINHPLSGGCG
ncbi:MAG: hypothetical protein K2Y28_10290 [Burkholderiaceae bacterium]|nr:hypothetical protein [Burkholderiaceae bacterium]